MRRTLTFRVYVLPSRSNSRFCNARNRFDQLQDTSERVAVPHDLLEIQVSADFLFKIELFLRQFLFEFRNLAVSQAILNGDGYLARRLPEEIDRLGRK